VVSTGIVVVPGTDELVELATVDDEPGAVVDAFGSVVLDGATIEEGAVNARAPPANAVDITESATSNDNKRRRRRPIDPRRRRTVSPDDDVRRDESKVRAPLKRAKRIRTVVPPSSTCKTANPTCRPGPPAVSRLPQ
jgi:hypothetical protein